MGKRLWTVEERRKIEMRLAGHTTEKRVREKSRGKIRGRLEKRSREKRLREKRRAGHIAAD